MKLSTSRTSTVFGLTLGVIAIGIEGLVLSPILNDVAYTFSTSIAQTGWAVSSYGFALALVAPVIGLWGNHVPSKLTMSLGLILFVLASILCSVAVNFEMLVIARALCGAAAGAFLPSCYAYIGDSVAYEVRAKVMGRVMAGWSIALILGIPTGSFIAQFFGWRATFIAVGFLGFLSAILVFQLPNITPLTARKQLVLADAREVLTNGIPLLLASNFFDMLSFYGVYTFLGGIVRQSMHIESGAFSMYVIFYGFGLLLSTMNSGILDKHKKKSILMIALSALSFLLLWLTQAIENSIHLMAFMFLWGLLQGIVQTGIATIMSESSQNIRSFAMASMSCTTYMAVAIGSMLGGWLLENCGFFSLTLYGSCSALIAGLFVMRLHLHK